MRIAPLPPERIEAALHDDEPGADADSWRLLRADVRASSAEIDPEFQASLYERLLGSQEANAPEDSHSKPTALRGTLMHAAEGSRARLIARLSGRPLASGALAALALGIIAVAIALPLQSKHASAPEALPPSAAMHRARLEAARGQLKPAPMAAPEVSAAGAGGSSSSAGSAARSLPSSGSSNGRLQQLGGSLTLITAPAEVQAIADGVSRLAIREGGFVQNSQINVEQAGSSEATLQLKIPSDHLARALAALGRLAPVRAQEQSLQDITGSYESARHALSDARAERAALLRALARASTQGAIESLHRRLALAAGTVERARAEVQSISRQAASSNVEVTVLASARAGAEGLTLRHGLHDAGRVLTVLMVVAVIGLAGLVPLVLVLVCAAAAFAESRRIARERALRRG